MDPKAFDQLFKEKVGEANALYSEEIQATKPYAWTAIQAELYPHKRERKWWFMAAACLLLLLSFGSFLFWQMEARHYQSMALLSKQFQEIKGEKQVQESAASTKDAEIEAVKTALQQLQSTVEAQAEQTARVQPMPHYIVQKDTVVVERIQYIEKPLKVEELTLETPVEQTKEANPPKYDRNVAIFPVRRGLLPSRNRDKYLSLRLAQLSK